jgi:hypothetical protein
MCRGCRLPQRGLPGRQDVRPSDACTDPDSDSRPVRHANSCPDRGPYPDANAITDCCAHGRAVPVADVLPFPGANAVSHADVPARPLFRWP